MERYDYGDYFSIKDTVAWINSYVMVKVVLNIVSETKEGKQRPYHSEIVSHKKSGNSGLTMMRDLSNCYLSIESRKTVNGNHGFAMIRNSSMSQFRKVINACYEQYDKHFNEIFSKRNGHIYIKQVYPITISPLPLKGFITFKAGLIETFPGEKNGGINMYLSSGTDYTQLTVEDMATFAEVVNGINLYTAAQNMANYIGRPEFGSNIYDTREMEDKPAEPVKKFLEPIAFRVSK